MSLLLLPVLPAWAAYPTVAATSTTTDAEGDTTALNMPASISAGDLLLQLCGHKANAVLTQSGGSDWTRIGSGIASSTLVRGLFAKVAAGSDTLTIDGTLDGDTACVGVRIPAAEHGVTNVSTDIELGATTTATSSTPDPPNGDAGVSKDFLVLVGLIAHNNPVINAYPTNYTETVNVGFAPFIRTALAQRNVTASSEDPGTATLASSEINHALTIMIPPPAVPGTINNSLLLLGVGR